MSLCFFLTTPQMNRDPTRLHMSTKPWFQGVFDIWRKGLDFQTSSQVGCYHKNIATDQHLTSAPM